MDVAVDPGIGPDLDCRAVGADPGQRQRGRDIDIGRKTVGGLARAAGEDAERLVDAGDRDPVLDQIGRAVEPVRRLPRDHVNPRDETLRRGLHRVEAQ